MHHVPIFLCRSDEIELLLLYTSCHLFQIIPKIILYYIITITSTAAYAVEMAHFVPIAFLSQVVCLARCNGATVVAANLADRTSEQEFRDHVVATSKKSTDYIIASYSRKGLIQLVDQLTFSALE